MSRLTNNKCCVRNAFLNVTPASLFFSSGSCSVCVKLYSFAVRVFAGVKPSARQQRLARTSCFHLHFKAKYQHRSETPPCRTSTPRYQFYVITRLLSFWHIGPSWSFAICSSCLCLLWLNALQASMAPGKGVRETGMLIKGSLFTGRNSFWEDVKKTTHYLTLRRQYHQVSVCRRRKMSFNASLHNDYL